MPHPRPIAIYGDTEKGAVFFEGSTVDPKFLGIIYASIHPTRPDRIVIERTDKYQADGVSYRKLFRRLNMFRIVDGNGVYLADSIEDGGLGYDAAAVVNYINREANLTGNTGNSDVLFEKLDLIDFTRDETDTSILLSNGDHYGVNSIRAIEGTDGLCKIVPALSDTPELYSLAFDCATVNGTAANSLTNCVNELNALFTVTALGGAVPAVTYTQDDGTDNTWNSEETETPAGGTVGTDFMYGSTNSQYHGPRIWTTETIDQPGEYYTFEAENVVAGSGPLLGIGLYSVNNGDLTEITDSTLSNSGHHGYFFSNWLYNYNGYTAPWTTYGSASSLSYGPGWNGAAEDQFRYSDAHEAFRGGQTALFKCGITDEGFVGVWYYDVEVAGIDGAQGARSNDWILMARSTTPVPAGSYGLLLKLANTSVRIRSLPRRFATDPVAPTLFYRYIESPDGNFEYPLFATAEEAEYVDTQNGGAGASDARVYVDEPTNTTWYSPVNGFEAAGAQAPVSGGPITYTEIATEADSNHTPPAFSASPLSVTEGQTVNYQTQPQDTNYTTTITGLPPGLVQTSDGRIVGDAEFIPATTEFLVNVARTNEFGTSNGTLSLTVVNDDALSSIPGWTVHQGNTMNPSTIKDTHASLLQLDTPLSPGQELTWTHVNYLQIGILNSAAEGANVDGEVIKTVNQNLLDNTINWWDLEAGLWSAAINHTSSFGVGWDNNSQISTGSNAGVVWKLEYKLDGYICLYRDTVLLLTSANTFTGDQTIAIGTPGAYSVDTFVPTVAIADSAYTGTTPPAGFEDPITAGEMSDPTTLGGDDSSASVVTLSTPLPVNQRFIVSKSFVDTNMLPFVDDTYDKNYFGVPKTTANWNSVDLHTDFDAVIRLEWQSGNRHKLSQTVGNSANANHATINSATASWYAYAIEWDGTDLHVIAHHDEGELTTEPGVNQGGTFDRVYTYANYNAVRTGDLPLVFATKTGGEMGLTTTGTSLVQIPFNATTILVSESSNGNGQFGGTAQAFLDGQQHEPATASFNPPTLNAGTTYTFVYDNSLEAGDYIEILLQGTTTPYTTGVTTFDNTSTGDPTHGEGYKGVTFAVPADVPPLDIRYFNSYQSGSFDTQRALPISGSTYVVPVTGITLEGPAANQTATVMDSASWLSLDETLGAGQRLLMRSSFINDMRDEIPNGGAVYFGLKSDSWTETDDPATTAGEGFLDGFYIRFAKDAVGVFSSRVFKGSTQLTYGYSATVGTYLSQDFSLEITNSGDNVRVCHEYAYPEDIGTTAYGQWSHLPGQVGKAQTGDQNFGLSQADVMVFYTDSDGGAGFDTVNVDWTALTEIAVPTPPTVITTPWTKAIDFSGNNERMQQEGGGGYSKNPLVLSSGLTVPLNADPTMPSSSTNARPWATAIVFKSDGNSSNQHIWNHGEGQNGDNVYLRVNADGHLYFGWGIDGGNNECKIKDDALNTNRWYGVYVAHKGARFSSGDATASNLAAAFDIYITDSGDSFSSFAAGNRSISSRWVTTGNRMNRTIAGNTFVGGRDSNRSFNGKVASFVVTSLRRDAAVPTETEALMMVRDPQQWLTDYKVGNLYRATGFNFNNSNFQLNDIGAARNTQVWLMGDGTSDAYAVMRNQVYPGDQNETAIRMISMVSNDVQTVNINGLS